MHVRLQGASMTSPWDLRVYTSMPTWVVAMGIKHDVAVHDGNDHWWLKTATANGAGFILPLHKMLVHDVGKPLVYKARGLIEMKFNCELYAEDWVQDMKARNLVEVITVAQHPGAELSTAPSPPNSAKARTCCATFENELHGKDCKDYITGRGIVATFPAKPPVAPAEPQANLCGRCWTFYNEGMGRPCGECKV